MDIDNGQRYELRLNSDDVTNILDGDILVTSLDNVEVWMALLNKVDLDPVNTYQQFDDGLDTEEPAMAPPADFIIPHAPDAAARPSVASGHRQRRSAPATGVSDHSDVLNAFAVGSAVLEGPSEPDVPELFLQAQPEQREPAKKRGIQITVEEEEGQERVSDWKPAHLTPKPPSNRKQLVLLQHCTEAWLY